jgi:membrane-associated protease RseP (regulator of RpoE activity)
MSAPKHLWSCDWEQESAAAAAARRARQPEPEPERETEPEQPPQRTPRPAWRPRFSLRLPRPPRTAFVIMIAALALAGAAWAVSSGGSRPADNTAEHPAWLGVQLSAWPGGVLVAAVAPHSPAADAGLHPGDVITAVQYRPAVAPVNVTSAIDALGPGESLVLQYERSHESRTAVAKLAARPASSLYS